MSDKADLYDLQDRVVIHKPTNGGVLGQGTIGYITRKFSTHYKVTSGDTLNEALMNVFTDDLSSYYADHELLLAPKQEEIQLELNFGAIS